MTTHSTPVAPVVPSRSRLQPLGMDGVRITEGFWADRQEVNRVVTIQHALAWEERLRWIGNFSAAADHSEPESRAGREFSDSEVYKLIEAMSWESHRSGDYEDQIARLGQILERAQDADGYLNTHFGQSGQGNRYSDFEWGHELYCYGHLFQAVAARIRTGHDDAIVRVGLRAADHVCATFGEDGITAICGHPEIEVGLAELGRATGRTDYIEQARLFIDRRGHGLLGSIEWGQDYFQDDMPVREAAVFRGHAVRAGYLGSGAIDVAVECGDGELLDAVRRQMERTLARRTYITGGWGSRHTGESFGEDFELPPDRAYCETCAAIGSVMVAWRLLLATGDERYADVIERALFNAIACSPSLTGDSFFYANPLQVRTPGHRPDPDQPCPRAESGVRAPWFTVSCCPTNLARLLASLSAYMASVDGDCVRIHQFATEEISATLGNGSSVRLGVRTSYPYDGRVEVTVLKCPSLPWSLSLRIPRWAEVELDGLTRVGRLAVAENLLVGDTVTMEIDITPRFVFPDPRIDAVRGCVAVERGPLVLCLESVDLPEEVGIECFRLDVDVPAVADDDGALVAGVVVTYPDSKWPYSQDISPHQHVRTSARLIPYHRWANRTPSTMRIWIPHSRYAEFVPPVDW